MWVGKREPVFLKILHILSIAFATKLRGTHNNYNTFSNSNHARFTKCGWRKHVLKCKRSVTSYTLKMQERKDGDALHSVVDSSAPFKILPVCDDATVMRSSYGSQWATCHTCIGEKAMCLACIFIYLFKNFTRTLYIQWTIMNYIKCVSSVPVTGYVWLAKLALNYCPI